jgi:hypothetical protein
MIKPLSVGIALHQELQECPDGVHPRALLINRVPGIKLSIQYGIIYPEIQASHSAVHGVGRFFHA